MEQVLLDGDDEYSKLLIPDHPLQVLPALAVLIGLDEAIFLQQLHYWLRKSTNRVDGRTWVYNSIPQWLEQFPFWSEGTMKRIVASLEHDWRVIITANHNTSSFDHKRWYTIDRSRVTVEYLTERKREIEATKKERKSGKS